MFQHGSFAPGTGIAIARWWDLGITPRSQTAHFPFAAPVTASLALQPRFATLPDIACEKITARDAILLVGRGKRRDSAAGSGPLVLPGQASVLATFSENLIHSRLRNGEVAVDQHFRARLGHGGGPERARLVSAVFVQVVELVGQTAPTGCKHQR